MKNYTIEKEPLKKLLKRYHAQFNQSLTLTRQKAYYVKGSKMHKSVSDALKRSQAECRKMDALIFDRALSQLITDEYYNHIKTNNNSHEQI